MKSIQTRSRGSKQARPITEIRVPNIEKPAEIATKVERRLKPRYVNSGRVS